MAGVTTKVYVKDRPLFARLKALSEEGLLATPVSTVPFSGRTAARLAQANIRTLGELVVKNKFELLKIQGLGHASLAQVEAYLGELGLGLEEAPPTEPAEPTSREAELTALLAEAKAVIEKLTGALS